VKSFVVLKRTFVVLVLVPAVIFAGELQVIKHQDPMVNTLSVFDTLCFDIWIRVFKECDPNSLCAVRSVSKQQNEDILNFCSFFNLKKFLDKKDKNSEFQDRIFSYNFLVYKFNTDEKINIFFLLIFLQ
jgi:hypothetical protein